jgi:hypothetical protein
MGVPTHTTHPPNSLGGIPTHPPGVAPGSTLHAETRQGERGGGAVQPMRGGEKVISRAGRIKQSRG